MQWGKSLPMWVTARPASCGICSKAFACQGGPVSSICDSCWRMNCGGEASSLERSGFPHRKLCDRCGVLQSVYNAQLWPSFCVPCGLSTKHMEVASKVETMSRQISFLQQFDVSNNFVGDVSLIVDNTEIQVNRFILVSKSPVFKRMMEVDMKEKFTGKVHIQGISAAVVRAAVNSMYTATIDFTDEVSPEEVLKFAHRYAISWLEEECHGALVKSISPANITKLLLTAYTYEAEDLKAEVKKYLYANEDLFGSTLDSIVSQLVGRDVDE